MRYTMPGFVALVLAMSALPAAPFSHDLFDAVLQTHVDSLGLVDYPAIQADRVALDAYIDSLGQYSPSSHPERFPTPQDQLAYWINAYNAFVLVGVVDAYPVKSVKDISVLNGFFRFTKFVAGGEELTLNKIENEIIRPQFKDPRIHFVVNCAALSCPSLQNRAFVSEELEIRLEDAALRGINNPAHVRLDQANQVLHLTKLLEWYGQDFIDWFPRDKALLAYGDEASVPTEPTLIDYLLLYLNPAAAAYLRQQPQVQIRFNHYDWNLNLQSPQ